MSRRADPAPDAERADIERVVRDLRRDPAAFADAAAVATAAGVDAATLEARLRRHFHATADELLEGARVAAARTRLTGDETLGDVATAVGFASPADFGRRFRRRARSTPARYRAWLHGAEALQLDLPARFLTDRVLAYLGRDPASAGERVVGAEAAHAVHLRQGPAADGDGDAVPAILHLRLGDGRATLRVEAATALSPSARAAAHHLALRLLGLGQDPAPFERRVLATPTLAPLVARRRGLTVPQTRDVFDGLVWVVSGQQVSLPVAYGMRRRLVGTHGTPIAGLVAPPSPARVAALDEAELRRLGFSRSKAEYLVAASRQVAAGELDLEGLATGSATAAEARLLAVRGLGPWSVHYLLMRAMGFADCLPVGDVGLERSLGSFLGLAERPRGERVRALMEPFAPYRSLATFHLWSRLEDEP